MKVAFCNNNIGGFYSFRKDVAEHFYKRGYEIILLYPACEDNIERRKVLSEFCRCIPVNMKPNGQNPLSDIPAYLQIRQIYKSEKPDIVFNYTVKPNIYSSIAAKSLGIPVVSMMAGLGYSFDGNSLKKKLARLLYKCGLKACDRVIMLNQDNYDIIEGSYVDRKRLVLFEGGEGVNMELYPYKENKFDEIHFLMIARLMYDKGYQQFVDAARIVKSQFPNVHFELLGGLSTDSPTRVPKEVLDKDIEDGYIEYLGVTNDVPSVVLRDGTVVVVASYYMEGMNRALMEACSMGRPIITTNMPGCKEMVDDAKTGYCIEPKSAELLADACIKFINLTKEQKEAMARASYEKCKDRFDVKDVLRRYDNIINELVKTNADYLTKAQEQLERQIVSDFEMNLDPLKPETLKLIEDCKAIDACGSKFDDDLLMEYMKADCFIMPSYREGFPNTVMEAGAMGLPSIVTDINGSREIIVDGENGLIVPPQTVQPLYDAMERMMNDKELREKMQKNARPMIESRFERSFVQRCLMEFYDEVLGVKR